MNRTRTDGAPSPGGSRDLAAGRDGSRAPARSSVVVIDREMRVLAWSPALAVLTGVGTRDAIGRRCWEVLRVTDEHDHPVCMSDCSLARLAFHERPVPVIEVSMPRPATPRMRFATHTSHTGRTSVVVHVLTPREQRGAAGSIGLTARQQETLLLLAAGHSTTEIAEALAITPTTARNHINACLRRLDCRSRVEAVVAARRLGLLG